MYVGILGKESKARAYQIVNQVRSMGYIAETDYMDRSVKAQMKYANKLGAKYTVIIGENEIKENQAMVKCMADGEQTSVPLDEITRHLV